MKRKQKNRKVIALAMVIILLISVGYAAISTNLKINGTANISKTSWSVYFTNVVINPSNNVASVTQEPEVPDGSTDTTQLNWEVEMDTPGQIYEFNVDVKNDGTIDAMIGDLANSTLEADQAKYLSYTVTYSDGSVIEQYDKLASGKKVTLNVKLQFRTDINAEDLPSEAEAISLSYESNYVQADSNAKTRNMVLPTIGSTVNYTTTLNEQTLNNWRIFYNDETNGKTYIILDDYLPNTGVPTFTGKQTKDTYTVFTNTTRADLINGLSTKENYDSLLTGTLNGTTQVNLTRSENVWAMGAPTLDLWVDSWNATQNTHLYTNTKDDMTDSVGWGYYVGTNNENTTSTYVNIGNSQTLYFPHNLGVDNCQGYWIASPSAANVKSVMGVNYNGYVDDHQHDTFYGARPIICLPTSLFE